MRISDWSSDVCSSDRGYAGDLRPAEAWALLEKEPKAVLVDVRNAPEWGFVGVPRLDGIGKEALCISWQAYPTMARNENFVEEVEAKGIEIGRAWCRARGCQYVSVSVDAEHSKKKTENKPNKQQYT